jgi:hypothetical protein
MAFVKKASTVAETTQPVNEEVTGGGVVAIAGSNAPAILPRSLQVKILFEEIAR